jgi:virulence-associated protein VapD
MKMKAMKKTIKTDCDQQWSDLRAVMAEFGDFYEIWGIC